MQKRKDKKKQARQEREIKMIEHLVSKGWTRSGPNMDVWKIDHWKHMRMVTGFERGYMRVPDLNGEGLRVVYSKREPEPWETDEVRMTLYQAYKAQLRLDSSGYERPKSIDDDLADLI
jgi:hypothetical protein